MDCVFSSYLSINYSTPSEGIQLHVIKNFGHYFESDLKSDILIPEVIQVVYM